MIYYPTINPEIFRIGPFAVRWYGLMYAVGFAASYLLVKYQIQKISILPKKKEDGKGSRTSFHEGALDSLYTYLILGLVIGARLGYVLFYDLSSYIQTPLEIFAVWHGGMSFHGGLVGCLVAGYIFCYRNRVDFWHAADLVIVTAPVGLGLGRIGNFINGELFGRVTAVPWGMVFPGGGPYTRHPSQLYEFILEGPILFIILWTIKKRKLVSGSLSAYFLILYGMFRFFVEFFREPDPQLGFIAGPFTMGQALSMLTMVAGIILLIIRGRLARSV
ncbi:MAG TPA: prolipoprotein diacylglyceryl transferase [Nitrospirota bacterium]|nr:prolipoprotein diacylglyceryl transferase [Nitrospirota bacterium]